MRPPQFPEVCCSRLGPPTEILTVGREHRPLLGSGFLRALESPQVPSCHEAIKKGRARQLLLVGLMAALGAGPCVPTNVSPSGAADR